MNLKATILVALAASGTLSLHGPRALAADDPPIRERLVDKPTIEFRDKERLPKVTPITLTIELDGTDEKFEHKATLTGAVSASVIALGLHNELERAPGWKCARVADENGKKTSVVIEGWTDPETKKFHPVKKIKFESKDLPKEYWPTIKMPPIL